MKIEQKNKLKTAVNRLHKKQKNELDKAVKEIANNPSLGEAKVGNLAGVFVYKFKMNNQLTLLAYTYEEEILTLTLLALGSHQNFYKNLKK